MALDRLGISKHVHPESLREIRGYHDKTVVDAVLVRAESYHTSRTTAPLLPQLHARFTTGNDNTKVDIILLNELASGRVDLLITEDNGLRRAAHEVGVSGVVSIAEFLALADAVEPQLPEYRIPTIEKKLIGQLDFGDPFFDSLRSTYPGFDRWLHRKADEPAYILRTELGLGAFLYLKFEDQDEDYHDISPPLSSARRLKIGTFKVSYNGFRVGERLLHIAFDAAIVANVDELYITIHKGGDEHDRLFRLLEHWGFKQHGIKKSQAGEELVLTRSIFANDDFKTIFSQYPRIRRSAGHFLVPIYPAYHTDLFPESILRTESPADYVELLPYRNGIAKSYISRSIDRSARPGDSLLFYRTQDHGPGWYTSVVTTLAVVEKLVLDIHSFDDFAAACRRRSIFSDDELRLHWDYNPRNRPFVVHLLHIQSFARRPNRRTLVDAGLIPEAPPRGLTPVDADSVQQILRLGEVNGRLIID